MDKGKVERTTVPVLAGYILGVLFTRISWLWASSYAGRMVTNIPDPGFPVKYVCGQILNYFGMYTLIVVAVFIYAMWVWSEPYRHNEEH